MTIISFYLGLIALLTIAISWLSTRKLKSLQKGRKEQLCAQSEPGPIPSFAAKKKLRTQQVKRMESRFSITRWTVILSIVIIGAGFAALPFIKQISPSLFPMIMGATSVIIGIAAKPFIENMICGLVLCYSKLARIGDTAMVDDAYGVIEDVTLTHCIIKQWDSLRYVVPNSSMMTKEFVNYSLNDNKRWVIVDFWVDYTADIEQVEAFAVETPKESKYFAHTDEPCFWVTETTQSAVKCMITAWATSPAEGWMLAHDIRKALLCKLQEHKISTHLHHIHTQAT